MGSTKQNISDVGTFCDLKHTGSFLVTLKRQTCSSLVVPCGIRVCLVLKGGEAADM